MKNKRGDLVGGLILIVLGLLFAAWRLLPGFREWLDFDFSWPLIVVGVGFVMLVLGLIGSEPGMAIPACIVMGVGGILWYQNATGKWESWSYAWALIPGFAGVGTVLSSLLGGKEKVVDGLYAVLTSLVLFVIFGSAFGAFGFLGDYWPILLIALGLFLLGRGFFRKSSVGGAQ
ncbi:MAG: hypothetical protein GXY76_18670 [Chloroflexi bacterium]|nr:hypothetical protein [Chloroflexota bacterium]